jgi:acyl carrier protein
MVSPENPMTTNLDRIIGWLCERKPELRELGGLDPDFDLIENRIVDSLTFLDFVFFLEELVGHELETGPEHMPSFRTLRAIKEDILDGGRAQSST